MSEEINKKVCAGSVHHVSVGVTDIDKSLPFYVDGLGLRKTLDTVVHGEAFERLLRLPENSSARTVFLQGSDRIGQVELVEWRTSENSTPKPCRPGSPGLCVLSFSVGRSDFEMVQKQLVDTGAVLWSDPVVSILDGYGKIMAFVTEDRDGNMIEVVCLPSDEEIANFRTLQQSSPS
jgi:catechol 2,3-dioxygenase-like lactoylglutathione lyase family enzyme